MKLFVLLFFTINLSAINIDPFLLKAQASIFPKIMLLDKDIMNKINDEKLILSIVYTDDETENAHKLKKMIDAEYKNKLGDLSLDVKIINIKDFDKNQEVAAYYIFNASSSSIKSVISNALSTNRICFGYSYQDFDKDILISMFVKERTYIYLNKFALQKYNIKFTPIFYKIVKVIE